MRPSTLPFFPADAVWQAVSFERAIAAIEDAVRSKIDPELDSARVSSPFPDDGEFLLMPSQGPTLSGVKVLTVAPNNPARGLEKIQGVYVLFDSVTAAPVAIVEAAALTAIRTPAVAMTALKHLAVAGGAGSGPGFGDSPRILTFGAGVQAVGHIRAAHGLFPHATFEVIGRRPERVHALRRELEGHGVAVVDRTGDLEEAVSQADIILCCTSSETPLFDGRLPRDDAIVVATGSHGLARREVDEALVARSDIAVEARASALRENGNLAHLERSADVPWWNLRDLVRGDARRTSGRPAFFSAVGMSWQDLVIATVVYKEGAPT